MDGQSQTGSGGIFTSGNSFSLNQDFKMIHKAIRGGWLTEERRGELLERAFNLALTAADEGNLEGFAKLAQFLESTFQFDVKREIAERKAGQQDKAAPAIANPVGSQTLEQRRAHSIERAIRLGIIPHSQATDN